MPWWDRDLDCMEGVKRATAADRRGEGTLSRRLCRRRWTICTSGAEFATNLGSVIYMIDLVIG